MKELMIKYCEYLLHTTKHSSITAAFKSYGQQAIIAQQRLRNADYICVDEERDLIELTEYGRDRLRMAK